MVKVNFKYKTRKFSFDAKNVPRPQWGLGLMFRSRNTDCLIFDFGKPVKMALTSWFVFFPFIAVWLDSKNNVLAVEKIRPFRLAIMSKKPFSRLLEIPINGKNAKDVALLCPPRR